MKNRKRLTRIFSVTELLLLIAVLLMSIYVLNSNLLTRSSEIEVKKTDKGDTTVEEGFRKEKETSSQCLDTSDEHEELLQDFSLRMKGILRDLGHMINKTSRDIKDKISFLTYGEIVTLACIKKADLSSMPVYTCNALRNETKSTASSNVTLDQQMINYLYLLSHVFPSLSHKDYETYLNIAFKGIPKCDGCAVILFCFKKSSGGELAKVITDPSVRNFFPYSTVSDLPYWTNETSQGEKVVAYRNVLPLIPCFHKDW